MEAIARTIEVAVAVAGLVISIIELVANGKRSGE